MNRWIRRNALSLTLLTLGILVLLVIIYFFWIKPNHELELQRAFLQPKEFLELKNNIRSGLAQAIGGAILLIGLFFTWRNIRTTEKNVEMSQANTVRSLAIAQEGQITDRFTRAVEQLGNRHSSATRLGGVYALERIAKDSEKDHWPIMEILTTYIRKNSPWYPNPNDTAKLIQPYSDIQAILTVLGRRNRDYEAGKDECLDLSGINLKGAKLTEAQLQDAMIDGSNLERAVLKAAHLEGASFVNSHLTNANLDSAYVKKTSFVNATMEGANLFDARGSGATFNLATLPGASFSNADLEGAQFIQANLKKAYFNHANLQQANFMGAHLEEADFHNTCLVQADFVGANLTDANIEGADLSDATGLTVEQIKATYGYGKAILPVYLKAAIQSEDDN